MANYKVGDIVTLKGKDELKKINWVSNEMLEWANERAMIIESDNENDYYTLDIDAYYIWGRSCFEGEPMNDDDLKEEYKDDYEDYDTYEEDDEDDNTPHTKFKVGDRVRVKNDIKPKFGVPYRMVEMAGKTATVVEIANAKTGSCFLKFDEDSHNSFIWFENLLEHIEDDDTPTMSSNEPKTFNIAKHKYDIGDYVRIVDINELERLEDDDIEVPSGVAKPMFDYASKLARITDIEYDSDNYWKYTIDLDDGKWRWNESMFEYRIGNYNDNTKSDFTYVIGYSYKDVMHTFEGRIENFDLNGKSTFIDKNGKILMIPYKDIAYIMPIED